MSKTTNTLFLEIGLTIVLVLCLFGINKIAYGATWVSETVNHPSLGDTPNRLIEPDMLACDDVGNGQWYIIRNFTASSTPGFITGGSIQQAITAPPSYATTYATYGEGLYWYRFNYSTTDATCPGASGGEAGWQFIYIDASGGTIAPTPWDVPPNLTERIIINSPPPDTASTTFDANVEYYISATTTFTHLLFQTCPLSYPNDECTKTSFPLTPGTTVIDDYSLTSPREGFHTMLVNFWNGVEEEINCAWWDFFCDDAVVIVGLGDSSNFNVATTTIDADVPEWILNGNFCGNFTGIIDAALCNGIANLFALPDNALSGWSSLQQSLGTKMPWGFFALVSQKLTSLGTASSTIGTDVVVDIPALGGSTVVFSWTGARAFLDENVYDKSSIVTILQTFLWVGWITFILFMFIPKQEKV